MFDDLIFLIVYRFKSNTIVLIILFVALNNGKKSSIVELTLYGDCIGT